MSFFVFGITAILVPDKQSQVIFIDHLTFVKIIFPDKAALFPVFRNGLFTQLFPVFVHGIHVKDENPLRIQIIVCQP